MREVQLELPADLCERSVRDDVAVVAIIGEIASAGAEVQASRGASVIQKTSFEMEGI